MTATTSVDWPGGGEMAGRIREHDWGTTSLGPLAGWSQGLKAAVDAMLASSEPVQLAWGPDQLLLYNDAFAPLLGNRHPGALGGPASEIANLAPPDPANREQSKLRTLFDSIDEGLAVVEMIRDDDDAIVDIVFREVNRAFERQTGVADVLGRSMFDVVPGFEDHWLEAYKRVARTGEPHRLENYQRDLDRWFDVFFSHIDSEGRFVATVFKDITDRKGSELALRESEERQAFLLKLSDVLRAEADGGAVADRAMRMLLEHLGLDRSYLFSWNLQDDVGYVTHQVGNDCAPALPPVIRTSGFPASVRVSAEGTLVINDILERPDLSDSDRANIAGLGMRALVSATLRKWGHPLWSMVAVSAEHRQWTPGEIKLVEEVAERTWAAMERACAEAALRHSEEKFRTLFESIDEGFCILELIDDDKGNTVDFRYVEANEEHDRQAGLGHVVGKLASEVVPGAEAYWFETFGEVARTGEPKRYENYNQDTGHWYDVFLSRVGGAGSRRVCVVSHDSTERKQSEERQAFLLKLADTLRPLADPVEVQSKAAAVLGRHFGAGRAAYAEIDPDGACFTVHRDYTDGVLSFAGRYPLGDYGTNVLWANMAAGRTNVITDAELDDRLGEAERSNYAASMVRAAVGVPLVKGGRLAAACFVHCPLPREWTAEEVALVEETAERTWAAVERARAEAALRESEGRLARALEVGELGAWELDLLTLDAWRSPQHDRIFGYETMLPEWTYDMFLEHVVPEDRGLVDARFQDAIAVRGDWDFECRVRRADREVRWIWAQGRVDSHADGQPGRMKGMVRDITERKRVELALRATEERQRFLLELGDIMRAQPSAQAIIEAAGGMLGEHLKPSRVLFAEFDEAAGFVHVFHAWLADGATPFPAVVRQEAFAGPILEDLRAGRTLWVDDAGNPPADRPDLAALGEVGIQAALSVPLIIGGRLTATLSVHQHQARQWTEAEVSLLQDVAERLWADVTRARTEAALRESEATLAADLATAELLRELAERLVTEENVGAIYAEILSAAVTVARSDAGTIQIYDPEAKSLQIIASKNFSRAVTDYFQHVDAGSRTACGVALNTGQRAFVDFPDEVADMGCELLVDEGLQSALALPLVSRSGAPLGMLNTHWRETRHRPTEKQLRFLELIARQAADLIEQRRAQRVLQESEERLRTAFSISTVGVLFWSADGKLADANEAFLRMSGFTGEEAIGKTWQDLTPPEFHGASESFLAEVERTGEGTPYEKQQFRSDGSRWWGMFAARKLGDGVVEFALDVDEQHRTQDALRESEERLRQFGEASHDILWMRDAETLQWQYLTPAFEGIYGLSREEALTGNTYRNWLELVVPEDRKQANDSIRRVLQGEHVTFDYRIRRPSDGMVRWLRNTDFPIANAAGKATLIGGIGHDLTELRETELRLKTLMTGIPQLVWRSCDDGQWTWASPQWLDFTGQTQEQSHGRGWLEAVHPGDREETMRAWGKAKLRGLLNVEYRVRRAADGQWIWHHTRSTPVRDQSGTIVEWLGTSTDIHALRELQERQKVLVAELQHRTRNLMGVVRSMSDKTARASENLPDFRGRFRDRLDALSRVQGLLSRLNEHDRVTFDELIETELSALNGSPERVTLSGPAGVRLRSSTVQTLAMALHELATNALKYGALGQPSGRLAVSWDVEMSADGGRPWLYINWQESGVVMPPTGAAPQGTGQGRELIERALPYQLSAKTTYTLGPDGVHCTISVPVSDTAEVEQHG